MVLYVRKLSVHGSDYQNNESLTVIRVIFARAKVPSFVIVDTINGLLLAVIVRVASKLGCDLLSLSKGSVTIQMLFE
jgi:hypothetical protein